MAKKQTKQKNNPMPVESIHHKDKRANIPTEELRDFVAEDERAPKPTLYPRDPSLDPQLVWKGKDDQDAKSLAVPVVPIYIQEKIHPQALIDALPRKEQPGDNQPDLFADFNGLPEEFDQRVDFYHHDGNWSNRMILGDSLLVMTSLAEKEGLKGKVQTIYIDPPYGIKFGSNWQVSTRKRDVKDGKAEDATRQPEQVRAFRDTWKLGIHSYLAYLRDRLVVARDLLTETGSVFMQIGDENVHLVRCVMDEVFGSENFAGMISFFKTSSQSTVGVPSIVDFLLLYAKDSSHQKLRPLFRDKKPGEIGAKTYTRIASPDLLTVRPMTAAEIDGIMPVPAGWRVCTLGPTSSAGPQPGRSDPYIFEGESYPCPTGRHWSYDPRPGGDMDRLAALGRLRKSGRSLASLLLAEDNPVTALDNVWLDTGTWSFTEEQTYVVQTGAKVIQRCLLMTTDPGDLVLDPTCGSGTTAYVAEQWGRRWITCDTSRVALALARTRLMAAKYPYYLLADSPNGIKKEGELMGKVPPTHATEGDIRKGFVYERVPHVTLKSIANNPDIREGMSRQQIDAAIARHTETETLYDKPYEDKKTIRVSGPFTVESLSPHRVLATADENMDGTVTQQEAQREQDFATMILDNLRKAGVQNTKKVERLNFDVLNPYAGRWLHAAGEYTDADGKTKRVAVSIGPEQGTVGPQQVKEAAKESVQGVGYDLLLVTGFAFDPHVAEEAKRYGKLMVLPTKMNPDLAMGDELLKKTGAGNLFMVFGEPDVEIKKQKDKTLIVEIKGIDVYDPTTGEIRSSSTDDIACWFIDTDYNGESFFVRHAYFTGSDEPYEKLKRALKAEIDEVAWSSLYSTKSRPFERPSNGKIALKVINHYGDEVLKVFEV
jgi:adenine-specific DNA-methyltransferase